jgi:hypothetical protein
VQATIKAVNPKPRVWEGPKGTLHFINVLFEDGSAGDYGAKPETSQQHLEALQALVGIPGEFELEPKPDFEGRKQFKVRGYPGQTIGKGFGGGGKAYVPSYTQTEQGFLAEQRAMNRRTALMQAVALVGTEFCPTDDALAIAAQMYDWLQAIEQKQHSAPNPPRTAQEGSNGGKATGVLWQGLGQCPACHCPAGKLHAPKCPSLEW